MQLREWNARLHGLVVFRALLGDPVVAKLAALTDRLEAADDSIAPCAMLWPPLKLPCLPTPPIWAIIFPTPCWRPRPSVCGRLLQASSPCDGGRPEQ